MTAIYLASAGIPDRYSAIKDWRTLAQQDRRRNHHLVDEPESADVVLFTECHQLSSDWRLDTIRDSNIARAHREKVYVYDQRDRPWCAFPGVYVSMPAPWLDRRFQAPGSYVPTGEPHVALGLDAPPLLDPDLLVSFVGSPTHPVRTNLVALEHPRGYFESVDGFMFHDERSHDFGNRRRRFAEVLFRSKFVLCPRGHGTSSIRLFETLAAGRVPVIVSDRWVPPDGPPWQEVSVRWPERGPFDALLEHLEKLEPVAPLMGEQARAVFEEWFAPEVLFDGVAACLTELVERQAASAFPEGGVRGRAYRRLMLAETGGRLRYRFRHFGSQS